MEPRSIDERSEHPFEDLYRRFEGSIRRYVARFVGEGSAWDVSHDVFVKAYERHPTWEPGIEQWLFVVAHNQALDHLRATSQDPGAIALERERASRREAAPSWGDDTALHVRLEALPVDQRRALELHYRLGCSSADTGRAMNRSADSVRHLEQSGLAQLRRAVRAR